MSDDTETLTASPFEIAPALKEGEDTGSVRMGPFERLYESLFAEALESGQISQEERERLDLAAKALGLDAQRVAALEEALVDAWEAGAAETVVHPQPGTLAHRSPPSTTIAPAAPATTPHALDDEDEPPTLSRPSQRAAKPTTDRPPAEVPFRELHARFDASVHAQAIDDGWRIAEVLVLRGAATRQERAFWEKHRVEGPVRPRRPLNHDGWVHLLKHPDEERTTGEIFAVIASAALVGRVSAMRRDGNMPRLDLEAYQNPLTSTVSAVRALSWAAATLGIRPPPAYVAPDLDVGYEIVTVVPPSSRIGSRVLSGLTAAQLAFACGRHMAWFREEHFICTLVPNVAYLESIFSTRRCSSAPPPCSSHPTCASARTSSRRSSCRAWSRSRSSG